MATMLTISMAITLTPAFASSAGEPWDRFQAVPNSTSGDERAIANAGSSDVYANVTCCLTFITHKAYVYQNENDLGVDTTPSLTVTGGASNVYFDVEYAYDGNIIADAWAGTAHLWLGAKVYKNDSLHSFHGNVVDGAGDKTDNSDVRTYNVHPGSGTNTWKASGYFQAKAATGLFGGHQQVDFFSNNYYILVKDISVRT